MSDYPYHREFPTRWNDNDVFGHVNNTVYYAAMDTTVTSWLLAQAELRLTDGDTIAVVRASSCEYEASVSHPVVLDLGLRAARLGTTSVTWEFGLRRRGEDALVARGTFVHVFVDRATMRPVPVPESLRARIEAELLAPSPAPDEF